MNMIKARSEKDWEEKYVRKAHGNGIGWQKMAQVWRDMCGRYRVRRV